MDREAVDEPVVARFLVLAASPRAIAAVAKEVNVQTDDPVLLAVPVAAEEAATVVNEAQRSTMAAGTADNMEVIPPSPAQLLCLGLRNDCESSCLG